MKIVVDTNAVLWACGSGEGLARLRRHDLFAPWLMWSEFTSALHVAAWRGQITQEQANDSLAQLRRLPIRPRSHSRLQAKTWQLADELGWAKTYDAEYLALADLLGAGIVTFDSRLSRAAKHLGVVTEIEI